jgi:CRP-like cAMP-binding protein
LTALLKTYLPSQIIFREGLPGTSTYVVRSGKVEISVQREGRKVILATLGEGALFGEMAPFDGGLRSATASAATACELWCIRTDGFKEMVDSCPPFVKTMVDSLVSRVRKLNTKLVSSANMESWLAVAHMIDLLSRSGNPRGESDSVVVPLSKLLERLPEILGISEDDTIEIVREMQEAKLVTLTEGDDAQIVVTQFKSFLSRVRVALRIASGRQHEPKETAP